MMSQQRKLDLKTVRGYPLDEVSSALQKSLRRGKELEALYWAEELFATGFERYLLYRLWIMSNEDIGPANPQLVLLTTSTYQCWLLHKREKKDFATSGENRVFNGNLVISLCRSPKCRVSDDATQIVLHRRNKLHWFLEVPDYAKDSHTKSGRIENQVFRHWVEIGSKCNKLVDSAFINGPNYKSEAETIAIASAEDLSEPLFDADKEVLELELR